MLLWIGIENFGKIEYAKICVNRYSILVGPNNSGKTYLMQLVEGLADRLSMTVDEDFFLCCEENGISNDGVFTVSQQNKDVLVQYVNEKLEMHKHGIIKGIFGKELTIGKIYIDLEFDEEKEYILKPITEKSDLDDLDIQIRNEVPFLYDIQSNMREDDVMHILYNTYTNESTPRLLSAHFTSIENLDKTLGRHLVDRMVNIKSLFLPASRTGLMTLYREFFANKADDAVSYELQDSRIVENDNAYGGMTKPMYEFLRFLQTYIENDDRVKRYKDELVFFDEKIIDGRLFINKNGTISYSSKETQAEVPLYLASSMINEVAPIYLALTADDFFNRLVIDEVESSLHPEKILELVRFFNRLKNRGMNLLVSTHSDTFASRLNNLYRISLLEGKAKEQAMATLELEEDDIVDSNDIFVYEFVCQDNGMSTVEEIIPNENGYMFDLFTKSALKLYRENGILNEVK